MVSDILKCAYFHYRGFAGRAVAAMEKARRDVATYEAALQAGDTKTAAKHRRYASSPWGKPSPAVHWKADNARGERLAYVADIDAAGLRLVGRVQGDCGGRNGIWSESGGWYTDPHNDVFRDGSGLCYGLVFQLPGRDGKARFVPGYEFGGVDGGPCVDFGDIREEASVYFSPGYHGFAGYWSYEENPQDMGVAQDVARAADGMAESAADAEKEYQAAWQAGTQWAEKGAEIVALKREAVQLLQERREARKAGAMAYPAMCEGLRKLITGIVSDIAEKREERAKLKSGDVSPYYFSTNDARAMAGFNEGAGV